MPWPHTPKGTTIISKQLIIAVVMTKRWSLRGRIVMRGVDVDVCKSKGTGSLRLFGYFQRKRR